MIKNNLFPDVPAYLNPTNHQLPLIELPSFLNPFPPKQRVRLIAHAAWRCPGGNLKLPPVYSIFAQAKLRGELEGKRTAVDSSSGNTAHMILCVSPSFGLPYTKFVVPADIPEEKELRLRRRGAKVEKHAALPGGPTAIDVAQELGREEDCFYVDQYHNLDNPRGHAEYTIKPVWERLGEDLTVYAAALGTTGTIVGARMFFEHAGPVHLVGGICAPNNPIPGARTIERLRQIGFDWRTGINLIEVDQKSAYAMSWRLYLSNLEGGPTSGMSLTAAIKFIGDHLASDDQGESLRNRHGEIVAVFMCGDTYDLYGSGKYTTILDPEQLTWHP